MIYNKTPEKTQKERQDEITEMEENLPIAEFDDSTNEVIELTKAEKQKWNSKKWYWKDSDKPAYGLSKRDLFQLIDDGAIIEKKVDEGNYIAEENPKVNLPTWF